MKLIPLTQGKFAQVDDEDYDFLMQWKWFAWRGKNHHCYYACRNYVEEGKRGTLFMHRFLMGESSGSKILVDHKDRNGLNNQRENLRKASYQQNNQNSASRQNTTSKFLGVSLHKRANPKSNRWCATIGHEGKVLRLGQFPLTPEGETAAARAYDVKARELFGEFANVNFKD